MSEAPELCVNRGSTADLSTFMKSCDAEFVPPLSARVNIHIYAQKITDKATRFEAWHQTELVGLVAAYCNDKDKRVAFITNVSVLPSWQGRGVAGRLIEMCLEYVQQHGLSKVELEVNQDNQAAVALYRKHGFVITSISDTTLSMALVLGK